VVEVISDSTRSKDYVKKLDLYMSCGISEYWIVDPVDREVHVFVFNDKELSDRKTYSFAKKVSAMTFQGLEADLSTFQ